MRKRQKEEREAIEAFVKNFPNSFVADLLLYFNKDIILQFIELYSGRRVNIPTIRNIWTNYRNQKIKKTLDEDNTRDAREILAENFGVSREYISDIYSKISKRGTPRIKHRTIERLVNTIFQKNLRNFYKEIHKLYNVPKHSVSFHNNLQNPEFLYILKQNKADVMNKCVEDITNHLVLNGREHDREIAVALLMKKFDEEL